SHKTKRMVGLAKNPEELSEELEGIRGQSAKVYRLTEYLIINKGAEKALLTQLFGNIYSTVKALCARGWLTEYDEVVTRSPYLELDSKPDSPPKLTSAQAEIVKAVNKAIDGGKGSFLLKGVTGSGKTEVYLHVIAHALSKGLSTIVLVPEISLTPQMLSRFRSRFGRRVAVLHSALSLGERADEWRRIYSGEADVVVGARSAVFAPVKNLGLIIIDEEHEGSYRSEMTPKYHAAEVAHKRLEQRGVILLGSATPSIERFYMANTGMYTLMRLDDRINNRPLPEVTLVDMREEFRLGNRGIFSECLKEKLGKTLDAGGQAILFLNRRGFSTFIMCRECGHVLGCDNCDA
ncbi:MAG TPA: primosomal protein N', partial [Clostridia bacterium]|nr:primosomal protein N' [Clostridia bacterium]